MAKLWTLATVQSTATAMIGNRSDLVGSTASLLANQALQEVWAALPHDLQEKIAVSSTTSGEDKITLPSDFGEVISLSDQSSTPPRLLSATNTDEIDSDSTMLSRPTTYALYSSWIELYPSPDSAYSIQLRYRARPSVLTETTDASSLDTVYDYAWAMRTASLYADYLNDGEQGMFWNNKYIEYMTKTRSDLAKRQSSREGMHVRYLTKPRGASSNVSWDSSIN